MVIAPVKPALVVYYRTVHSPGNQIFHNILRLFIRRHRENIKVGNPEDIRIHLYSADHIHIERDIIRFFKAL